MKQRAAGNFSEDVLVRLICLIILLFLFSATGERRKSDDSGFACTHAKECRSISPRAFVWYGFDSRFCIFAVSYPLSLPLTLLRYVACLERNTLPTKSSGLW